MKKLCHMLQVIHRVILHEKNRQQNLFLLLSVFFFLLSCSASAWAEFALVLPEKSVVKESRKSPVNFTLDMLEGILPQGFTRDPTMIKIVLAILDPFSGRANSMQTPQALTVLRLHGTERERTEHLSVLKEIKAFGKTAWQAEIGLPVPGVYHFIMQSKAVWQPEKDQFVQYCSKVQVPVFDSSEGWDQTTDLSFEILPLVRPFGLCAGMTFTGRVLRDGLPVPDALIEIAWLNTSVKADMYSTSAEKGKNRKIHNPDNPYQTMQEMKADDRGIFTFACPQPGWWAFAASTNGDPLQNPAGKLKPLQIKTIFWLYLDPCREKIHR